MPPLEPEAFLKAILSLTGEAIIGTNAAGSILSWNDGAARLFGLEAGDAIGRHISIMLPCGADRKLAAQDGPLRCTVACTAQDGSPLSLSLSACRLHDTGEIAFLYMLRDISAEAARDDLERLLKEKEAYIDVLLDHIPDPIFFKDRQHRWIKGNAAFWELLEGPPEKFIGKSDYDFFSKPEADHFWAIDDRVFAGEVVTVEETLTKPGREPRVISTKKAVFSGEYGEKTLVGVIRDITLLKKTEDQLRAYAQMLERSNQDLEDFAYIASHDLKEPLRGMSMQARFLLEDYADRLDEPGTQRLQRLIALSCRVEQLISDLLYYSRIGRAELAVKETDLNAVVEDVCAMHEPFLKQRNAHIGVPQPLPPAVCDKVRVREVFRNLIVNAVKYNTKPEKNVEVGFLEAVETPLGRRTSVYYVRDNGVGIPAQFHEEIFRMFRRLQPAGLEDAEGTGAGLTIVKKIVERHGGHIWLESREGEGTVFYFTLKAEDVSAGMEIRV